MEGVRSKDQSKSTEEEMTRGALGVGPKSQAEEKSRSEKLGPAGNERARKLGWKV